MTDAPARLVRHLSPRAAGSARSPLPERPVTVHVQGEGGEWRDFDDWPPPGRRRPAGISIADGRLSTERSGHEQAGAGPLPVRPRRPDAVDRRHRHAHRRRGRQPRARGTTPTCSSTRATMLDRTARAHRAGVGGAVRDVERSTTSTSSCGCATSIPTARSFNVCDGLQRFGPSTITRGADGVFRRRGHASGRSGHRFAAGHRLRVQVSSGCAPRLRAEPRHRRTGDDRDRDAGGGRDPPPRAGSTLLDPAPARAGLTPPGVHPPGPATQAPGQTGILSGTWRSDPRSTYCTVT